MMCKELYGAMPLRNGLSKGDQALESSFADSALLTVMFVLCNLCELLSLCCMCLVSLQTCNQVLQSGMQSGNKTSREVEGALIGQTGALMLMAVSTITLQIY
jgi:hypothetical protein